MNEKQNILNELKTISSFVANIGNTNIYAVPANYFEYLLGEILATINNTSFTTEANNNFTVPAGYFDTLGTSILEKIRKAEYSDELKELSPLLAGISNSNVYSVPGGYFNQLTFSAKETGKVVSFGKKQSIFKYAVAAVATGILGFGIFTFVNKNIANAASQAQTAAIIKNADEIIKTNSFDATLESLSDKDLEKYLMQNGENIEASMVASATEANNLPDALDYYLDPNTLDDYIKENNLKN